MDDRSNEVERTRERDRTWRLSRDLMAITHLDTTPVAINPAWQTLLGWSDADLMGSRLADLIHPDDRSAALENAQRIATLSTSRRMENRYRHHDGSYRWVSWSMALEDGLIYSVGRDITDEKIAAQALASANRQLLAQIEERERAETALHQMQRLEAVGQLTAGVAHDFNNLLTIILGNINLLMRQADRYRNDPDVTRRLSQVKSAAERGAKLTGQLLAFSRRQKLEPEAVDLNQTVESMRELLQSTAGSSTRVNTELAPDLWRALVDPTQIELIILNLTINARDAMDVGGQLLIKTANSIVDQTPVRAEDSNPGEYVMLSVIDSGSGMSGDVLAKAFEPFFSTKEVGKGSGLGLAQVYGFAKQSGGGVKIDTRLGRGTSVSVFLPRSTIGTVNPVSTMHGNQEEATPSTGIRTILLADDDDAVREVTATLLRGHGYQVIEANSGSAALARLAQTPQIDLLLLDFAMPGMSGATVAREAALRQPSLPVLFITGYVELSVLRTVEKARILQKPFHAEDLIYAVQTALNERADGDAGKAWHTANIVHESAAGAEMRAPMATHAPLLHILYVEDNKDMRETTTKIFEILGYRVTAADSAEEALVLLPTDSFDVLMTDISLPHLSGVDLTKEVARRFPHMRFILASGYEWKMDWTTIGLNVTYLKKPFDIETLAQVLGRVPN